MARLALIDPDRLDEFMTGGVVLLDFLQESCRPCHALEPQLAAFARAHRRDLRAYRVDVDRDADTPRHFGVMSLPSVLVLRDGHELARLDGLITNDDLERALAQASAVSPT